MKRIFIAVKVVPDREFMKAFSSLRSDLATEKIKWVEKENIHITLSFLGEIDEERVKAAALVLKQKCTGYGEFKMSISGAGLFRNINDPRVIWAGIKDPGKLAQLAEMVNLDLKDTGFKTEDRPFKAHLTLGRIKFIKDTGKLSQAVKKYQDSFNLDVEVKDVILFESLLRPEGPLYKELSRFRLS